jgi:hypothetical protein
MLPKLTSSYEQHDPADPRNKSRAGTSPARHGGQGVDFLTARAPRPHGAKKGWNDEPPLGGSPSKPSKEARLARLGIPHTSIPPVGIARPTASMQVQGGDPVPRICVRREGARHTLTSPATLTPAGPGHSERLHLHYTGTPTNPAASRGAQDRARRQQQQPAAAAAAQRSGARVAGNGEGGPRGRARSARAARATREPRYARVKTEKTTRGLRGRARGPRARPAYACATPTRGPRGPPGPP